MTKQRFWTYLCSLRSRLDRFRHTRKLQRRADRCGWSLSACDVRGLIDRDEIVLVDLRNGEERKRSGEIAGAMHVPFSDLDKALASEGMLHRLAVQNGKCLIFFCAVGGRSAAAVHAAQEADLTDSFHMKGGIEAWKQEVGTKRIQSEDARPRWLKQPWPNQS